MTISKENKEKALKLGRRFKVDKIWVNESGECFTEEQFAKASVKGDKEKYAAVEVTAEVKKDVVLTQDDLLAQIEAATDKASIGKMLAAEKKGEKRQVIIDACNAKLAALK